MKGIGDLELHGVYTAEDLAMALNHSEPIGDPRFTTHKRKRLMVLRTNHIEVAFEILTGGRLHLVEKTWLQ